MSSYTPAEIEQFRDLAASLLKWRRSEILDEADRNVVPLLYEDLLPDEYILKRFMKPIRPSLSVVRGRESLRSYSEPSTI